LATYSIAMAAVTTKKPGADRAVQLTFPTVFEYTYAAEGIPKAYYPEEESAMPALPEGTDLQADYHRQKQADANRMAMAGVAATKAAERRFLTSHANYYDLPPVVLGQRIYANPSFGSGQVDIYSARRDQGVLVGGVLRTAEGQSYGRQLLQARVAQLDAIDAAQSMQQADSSKLPEVAASTNVDPLGETASNLLLELSAGLENIQANIATGQYSAVESKDVLRTMQLLFRVVPSANREELEGLSSALAAIVRQGEPAYLDAVARLERAMRRGRDIGQDMDPDLYRFAMLVFPLVRQAFEYLNEMRQERNMALSARERLALSKALVKKHGLRSAREAAIMTGRAYEPRVPRARIAAEFARLDALEAEDMGMQARMAQPIARAAPAAPAAPQEGVPLPEERVAFFPGAGAGAEAAEADPGLRFRQVIEGLEAPEADRLLRAALRGRFQERQRQAEREADAARRAEAEAFFGEGRARGMRGGAMRMPHAVAQMSSSFTRQAPTREDSEHADSAYATFFGEGAMRPKQRVRGGEVLGRESRNTIHFDHDQRNTFADRSGAYFREGPAGDYPATPGMETAPNVQNTVNQFRQPVDNTLPMRVSEAAVPLFPEGAAPAAAMDAAAMQGEGNHRRRAQLLKKIRHGGMDGDTSKTPRTAAYRAMLLASEKRGELASEAAKLARAEREAADTAARRADFEGMMDKVAMRGRILAREGTLAKKAAKAAPKGAPQRVINEYFARAEADDGSAAPGAGAAPARLPAIRMVPKGTAKAKEAAKALGSGHGLTRAALPKDREGFVALAEQLKSKGHSIRVNKNSKLASIRANFIRKLGL
jgi:hypothetical protein